MQSSLSNLPFTTSRILHKSLIVYSFTHKYTNEIFNVSKVLKTAPVTYEIVDLSDEPIVGKFYSSQLVRSEF
jgi:hypothetical protein